MSNAVPILRAEGFGRRFGVRQVLVNASLWLYPGKVTALFGRNGSGKSTLLRTLTGRSRGDYGVVHFNGKTIVQPRLHVLAQAGLFYVPEGGILSPLLTLAKHISLVTAQYNVGGVRVCEVVDLLELSALLPAWGSELSPGERIRASFALALLREPLCLLADEPFLGIAPLDGERIAASIRELRARGCAIAVTGHETEILLDLADDVVWLTAGTTHALGSCAAARQHAQFCREYLAQTETPPRV